ncbi:SIS domain-containing protein [Nitrospirillum sp. BR 11163]|uniref:D-sedoheptulose-7-phosphate isomerase n=1 Tax=Nitrospirillum sp. BR 11163 TaxID=3104323 RepID=UPI002AFDF144|nr:SIS domain-containing protein [Nitrospirillum sp. BR 11163]MEA1672494.1 SIS domain-containing protein [Nitrospirillum sp. BR 11163]
MLKFPSKSYEDCGKYGEDYFDQLAKASATVDRAALQRAADLLTGAIAGGATLYACGNGGSAAIANHLVCDCVKGVRTDTTVKPRVHSLSANIEIITAIANDIAYEDIFSFQLESYGRPGDVLIAISSSGGSPNIIKAIEKARELGMKSIAMTGFTGGASAKAADVSLHVDAHNYGVVEDLHQSFMHLLAQFLRQRHMPDERLITEKKF